MMMIVVILNLTLFIYSNSVDGAIDDAYPESMFRF
jgi:hypothetical protein